MTRKIIIIGPNDNCLEDILNMNLDDYTLHTSVAMEYARNMKIDNVTEGYNDLASENYVVIMTVDNIIEFYAGRLINNNQLSILKELFSNLSKVYDELNLELGIYDNKQLTTIQGGFSSLDELLSYGYGIGDRKDDKNVRKKI